MNKFFGHLNTIHKHRKAVRKLCFKCGLYWQGITHDLSKYSAVEFINGVKFFTGKASPHYGERKANGFSIAWIHHHNRNPHHCEYWVDIMPNGQSEPIPMPLKYLAEMLCDRVAASKTYLKDEFNDRAPLDYYLSHIDENKFHPDTRKKLEYYLYFMAEHGMDKMFEILKEELKNNG